MATEHDTSTIEPTTDPQARYTSEVVPPASLLHQRVAQARAVSLLMTGEGFDHFTQFPPEIQHDALAALDSLLDDAATAAARVAWDCVDPRAYAGVPARVAR